MMGVWMPWGAAIVVAGSFGLMVWWLVNRPRALSWVAEAPTDPGLVRQRQQRLPSEMQPWLILLPARWMRWSLRHLQWMGGAVLAVITGAITLNPIAAVAFGWMGFWIPEILLRDAAWQRWSALDRAAYSTMYSARFYLEQGKSVLDTLQLLIPQSAPAFQKWMQPCLLGEADKVPLEVTLKDQALGIHHAELAVTADILLAQRQHGQSVESLAQVLQMWGKRIELEADRRGSLAGFVMISRLTIAAGIVLFWGLTLGDATIRAHMHTWTGAIVTGFSAIILAVALTFYHRQNRRAEQF